MDSIPAVIAIVRDAASLETIQTTLGEQGMAVRAAGDAEAGWDLIRSAHADAILVDSEIARGTSLLESIADWDPGAQVLLLTDHYTSESAVEEIQHGACDCLSKPLAADELRRRVAQLLDEARLRRQTLELDERLLKNYRFHGMVGRSPQMLEIFARIRRVAPHYRVVLISGATGTGKELVAHALHELSPVAARRFAVCNCSAIVETLMESELFGHVRGAFTGATQDRAGLFEYAHGGTVFLDEIADMPLAAQSKLLRVMQNQELQRVGSPDVRKVDVRVIAATNRDMRELVAANQFREDLYYRLSMVELTLPRLADRKEDLPLLERHFVDRFARNYGKRIGGISRRAQTVLSRHTWPGNVRELENVIGHGCMMAESEFIDVRDLPGYLRGEVDGAPASEPDLVPLADLERNYTQHVLARVGGNKLHAAQVLGISRATLYRILR
ncbi:MAG TPA: sigma-54 dependent transcriptional regulator, partial [Bryobacteraceae bacterium]|nr:sigma-54 dependent transcriptional regulator [Bryobacteraceae bacterium]